MKKTFLQKLGLLGIVSLLSYTAAVVFSPLAYPGYNWMAQAVSDLSAANAPSLALWNQLSALYNACEVVCTTVVCIGIQGQKTRLLRAGVYLFAVMEWVSAIGYRMFPLSDSGYAGAFQDVMHMAVTAVVVLLSIVSLTVIIMAGAKNRACRSYGVCAAVGEFNGDIEGEFSVFAIELNARRPSRSLVSRELAFPDADIDGLLCHGRPHPLVNRLASDMLPCAHHFSISPDAAKTMPESKRALERRIESSARCLLNASWLAFAIRGACRLSYLCDAHGQGVARLLLQLFNRALHAGHESFGTLFAQCLCIKVVAYMKHEKEGFRA